MTENNFGAAFIRQARLQKSGIAEFVLKKLKINCLFKKALEEKSFIILYMNLLKNGLEEKNAQPVVIIFLWA